MVFLLEAKREAGSMGVHGHNKLLYHVQQAGTARRFCFLQPREHWVIGVFSFNTLSRREHDQRYAFLVGLAFFVLRFFFTFLESRYTLLLQCCLVVTIDLNVLDV